MQISMCGIPTASCLKRLVRLTLLGSLWWVYSAQAGQGLAATADAAPRPIAPEDFASLDYVLPRDPASAWSMTPRLGNARLAVQSGARVAGTALKWTLAGPVDAVALTRPVYDPPGNVVLWVKNPHGLPVTLRLLAVTIPGGVLQWPTHDVSACKNWTRLTWQPEAAEPVSSNAEGNPLPASQPCSFLPICEWRIVAERAKSSGPADIYLDEFSVEPAPEHRLVVRSIRPAAQEVRAGKTLDVQVHCEWTGTSAIHRPRLCLVQSDGQPVAWRYLTPEKAADAQQTSLVSLAVPATLSSGEYQLLVRAAGAQVDGPAARGVAVTIAAPARGATASADVLPHAIADLTGQAATEWRLSPTRMYLLPACANFDAYGRAPDVTSADGGRRWDGLDEILNALVQHDPEAKVLLLVFVGATPAWLATHPDDCAKFLPARQDFAAAPRLRQMPSFSSTAWRQAATTDVAELMNHLAASPWADLIAGYVLSAGDGTWAMPVTRGAPLPDYSPAALSAFRAWLRDKYQTLPELRTAWGHARHPVLELLKERPPDEPQPIMAWDDAAMPDPQRRLSHPTALLEPPMFQDVADFTLFLADESAAAAAELARAAKKHTKLPVGVLYGGWLADAEDPVRLAAAGHLGTRHLLRSPDVDFVVFETGDTSATWAAPFASANFLGKPWLVRLTSTQDSTEQPQGERAGAVFAAGAQGVIAPARSPQLTAAWRWPLDNPQNETTKSQVAAIVDATSAAHLSPASGIATVVLAEQMRQLEASGLRYEIWDLAEVLQGRTPAPPVLLFVNTYVLGERERELLATLRSEGRVLVFSYAAGAMRPRSGVNGRDVFSLTGIPVTTLAGNGPLRVVPTPDLAPFTLHVPAGTEYGTEQKVSPWFCCVDTRAEVLGKIAGTNAVGLAALRGEGWTSVYSAAPALPATLLRSLAQMARASQSR